MIRTVFFAILPALMPNVMAQEPETPLCAYPKHNTRRPFRSRNFDLLQVITEAANNNTLEDAQKLKLGTSTPNQDIDIEGAIERFEDEDWYRFEGTQGDVLGAACHATYSGGLDSFLQVLDEQGNLLVANKQHRGLGDYYPQDSPLPVGRFRDDSALSLVLPASGPYFIRVSSPPGWSSKGEYLLQLRLRRPALEKEVAGVRQTFLLDFDGADLDAEELFGRGLPEAELSGLADFMKRWSLKPEQQDEVERHIIESVRAAFTGDLLVAANATFAIDVANMRTADVEFGDAHVARVVVGGTVEELGIRTIGIAECVDPGNFHTADTAVVLLDLLSAAASNPNSVNQFSLNSGLTKPQAVGRVVGAVVAHEIAHLLGNWHCRNDNDVCCYIDRGGDLGNLVGTRDNTTMGDAGDVTVRMVLDDFAYREEIAERPSRQNVAVNVAYGLSVGTLDEVAHAERLFQELLIAQLLSTRSESELYFAAGSGAQFVDGGDDELGSGWSFVDGLQARSHGFTPGLTYAAGPNKYDRGPASAMEKRIFEFMLDTPRSQWRVDESYWSTRAEVLVERLRARASD